VLVFDPPGGKNPRRAIYSDYCRRPESPKEWWNAYKEAEKLIIETVLAYGGTTVTMKKPVGEADDIIAALAPRLDCTIWSSDADLLAYGLCYSRGEFNPGINKFMGLEPKDIPIFKSLVGDTSDGLPGAKGFGPTAFMDMVKKFGIDSISDMRDMLEERTLVEDLEPLVAEFKPFQKVIDNAETVYACYDCIKPIHPGYGNLEWTSRFPKGNGILPEHDLKVTLVTQSNYYEVVEKLPKLISDSEYLAFDVETDVCQASRDWSLANKTDRDKQPPIDIVGSELAGFSLTTGRNHNEVFYFSIDHADTDNITLGQAKIVLSILDEKKYLVVQNCAFELVVVRNHFELPYNKGWLPNVVDTKILAGFIDEYQEVSLKPMTMRYLGYKQTTYEEVLGDKSGMRELTGQEVLNYGCDDSIVTGSLFSLFRLQMAYEDTWQSYLNVDQIPQYVYAESFLNGIKFDLKKLKELDAANVEKLANYMCAIEDTLATLEWEEVIEDEEDTKVTFEDLLALKNGGAVKEIPEVRKVKHRWPGCEFVPAEKITVKEIKRLYQIYSGDELITNLRSVPKVIELLREMEEETFAVALEEGLVNGLVEPYFKPKAEINLRSYVQLGKLLYETLQLPVRVRNKLTDQQREKGQSQGNPGTDETAIVHSIIYDVEGKPLIKELLENIIEAKSALTEESLFFRPYKTLPHWKDSMVHSHPGQSKTKSGRAAPSRPNLSQQPKESELRKVVVSEEDHVVVSLDMNSQELVHIAERSQDTNMVACYEGDNRKDIHGLTGLAIYNLDHDPISYEQFMAAIKDKGDPLHSSCKKIRSKPAKVTNFLSAYGGTFSSLALKLRIPEEAAKKMMEARDEMFPGEVKWKQETMDKLREDGYAVESCGRRRHLLLNGDWRDEHELRSGLNHLIQGSSASQIKLVLKKVYQENLLEKYRAFFLFSVHDEVVFSCYKGDVVNFLKEMHIIMKQQYCDFKLQFGSSIAIGPSFGELTEVGDFVDEEKINKLLETL